MKHIGLGQVVFVFAHILKSRRSAVVPVRDNHLVLDDDGAVTAAETGGSAAYGSGDVEEVFGPVGTGVFVHDFLLVIDANGHSFICV